MIISWQLLQNQAWNDSIKIYFIMYLSVFPAYMPSAHESQKGVGSPQSRAVHGSATVCAENQTRILQNNKCS